MSPAYDRSPVTEDLIQLDPSTDIEDEIRSAEIQPARARQTIPVVKRIFFILISLE